jgi:alpha-1,3-rhamnosyl/mannosyltransferase
VELLSQTNADFVLYPNFLSYPSLRHTPSAPVNHDLTYLDLPEYVSRKNQQDLERFVPIAVARSSFVVTVSRFTKQKIAQAYHVPSDRILVTPIPPEPKRKFGKREEASVLLHAGIRKPFILYLSTIEPRKNLISILEAYTQLPVEHREYYTMVVAGRIGWNCEAEEAKIRELRAQGYDIKFLGYVDELMRAVLFKRAVLYINASGYEGFGMPLLEAMSYGTPVAASDIPVFHEVAGTAASYFNQESVPAIARCLQNLLDDDDRRRELRKRGQEQAGTFDWGDVAHDVYKKILQALEKKS